MIHSSLYIRTILTFCVFGLSYVLMGGQVDRPHANASPSVVVKRPIIDMHLHAIAFEDYGRPPNPATGKPPEAKTSADLLRLTLEAMDRYNIKLGMLSGRLETVCAWKAKAPERFLASVAFSGRPVMFGSDQAVWPEIIGQAIEGIESAPFLTDEQKHDIFYNNAARFLGLPEVPSP